MVPMSGRREPGSLEAEILGRLSSTEAMTPADLKSSIGDDLSYSTITTVLARLGRKGLVKRQRDGRGFNYRLAVDGAAVVAERMHAALQHSSNRPGVLQHFVSDLDPSDAASLRQILEQLEAPR